MITTPRELLKIRALSLTIYTVQAQTISLTVSYPNTQLAIIFLYVLQEEKSTVRSCHISTTYGCFKSLNEETFLADLSEDFSRYSVSESDIEEDLTAWYDILLNRLNQHAPIKTKKVKTKRMPPWYNPNIAQAHR